MWSSMQRDDVSTGVMRCEPWFRSEMMAKWASVIHTNGYIAGVGDAVSCGSWEHDTKCEAGSHGKLGTGTCTAHDTEY